ncbi:MAG: poly-gamma-glutamate system protein, partial [Bacteroidales bacterium]|nr:poly-gamma-glutamate system protein [Bacteroidales bacterium]
MRKPHPYTSLVIMLFVLCCGFFLVHLTRDEGTKLKIAPLMVEAAQLSQHWMDIISAEKATRDIYPDVISNVQNQAMIGNDFTMITTTLGSLQSKEISTNPDFAALMVRWMAEAGLERGAKAGVIASGSFPSLIVSTLSALQTLDADVVLLTSVGASSYGANQPAATWPDMEYWLQQNGN